MEEFDIGRLEESFGRFERAASKGHEESIWILSVWKDVQMENFVLKEAFAEKEEPLGWCFAGRLSRGREQLDFYKKSAERGCSWGQVAYGESFKDGWNVAKKDEKVYLAWLEKAANQKNPWAMELLGHWFLSAKGGNDKGKAASYFLAAAELGWKNSMYSLSKMLRDGDGCVKDLRQAAIWSAKGDAEVFWEVLKEAERVLKSRATEDLDYDFNQLCYSLGWGLYWSVYGSGDWIWRSNGEEKAFGNRCLDYYCSCVALQQKSIFTFLLCWNRTTGGVKGPGQMIAQMVWEGREDNLVKNFEESEREELETK
jgi:hypothetical protein